MPFDVTMPDGTVITGVPDGTTKADLQAKYAAHTGQTQNAQEPNSVVDALRSIPGGLAKGAAALVGLPGDIKQMADQGTQAVLKAVGLGNAQHPVDVQELPTTAQVSHAIAEPFGGYYQPKTTAGEYAQTVAQFAPAALSPGGVAARVARVLVPGVADETAGQLTKGSEYEPVARAAGALAGSFGLTGAKALASGVERAFTGAGPTEAAEAAHDAGYVLPPAMASEKPGIVSRGLSMLSGKIKLQQAASAKNQEVTNRLASEALGLSSDAPLNADTFKAVRDQASQAYKDVASSTPQIVSDRAFTSTISSLGKRTSEAAKAFPGLVKNDEIENLVQTLTDAKSFSPQAGLEVVRHLRSDATANLKAFNDPAKQALGLAQRQAAEAVDDLIERNLTAAGKPDLVQAYRDARQQLARSYDVEAATDPGGNVNARMIGALQKKGRPLTGQLKDIADTARNFPKATQNPSTFGGKEDLSVIDAGMAGLSHGATLPLSLARPVVRTGVLSTPYQNALMRLPRPMPSASHVITNNPLAALLALPNARQP